jgi:hypothetical protein
VTVAGVCCERCPTAAQHDASHFARRRQLKSAVFAPQSLAVQATPAQARATERLSRSASAASSGPAARDDPPDTYRTVTGQIVDVSPHVITIGDSSGERRFALTPDAMAWRGGTLEPASLSRGDEAVIRLLPSRPDVADRIWASIGRVTGRIVSCEADHVVVDEGTIRRAQTVVIPPEASEIIEVRFPNLKPGYLIDVLGIRRSGYLEGLIPATSQPPYRSDLVPSQRMTRGRGPDAIAGSATWHDSADEPHDLLGVCYPAIDPAAGCAEDAEAGAQPGKAPAYRHLPYLAVGTALNVRNECTRIARTLPVTGCALMARLFNDHCVTCGVSPRGRVAELTIAGFIALGGELEAGCFNATLTIGR